MGFNSLVFCKIFYGNYLLRNHARNDTAARGFGMPYCNLCKVRRIFAFGKHNFRHSAPHCSAEVKAGKITYVIKSDPFDLFCCTFDGNIPVFVTR